MTPAPRASLSTPDLGSSGGRSSFSRVDLEPNVYVSFTKDQIKDLPEYDSYKFDEDYRTRGDYYSERSQV